MVAVAGMSVPVAEYATYGTPELAHNAVKALGPRDKAVLLANHGILAGAADLMNAFNIIEEVEYCSKIYCLARHRHPRGPVRGRDGSHARALQVLRPAQEEELTGADCRAE